MNLPEPGWVRAAEDARLAEHRATVDGVAVALCGALHEERHEVVLDVAQGRPGQRPQVSQPRVRQRLRVRGAVRLVPAASSDPPSELFWNGEGWLNGASEPAQGPVVALLDQEALA